MLAKVLLPHAASAAGVSLPGEKLGTDESVAEVAAELLEIMETRGVHRHPTYPW
jgi:hypothetical protein